MSHLSALKVVSYHFNNFFPLNEKLNLENKRFFFAVLLKIKKKNPKDFDFAAPFFLFGVLSLAYYCAHIVVAQFH